MTVTLADNKVVITHNGVSLTLTVAEAIALIHALNEFLGDEG